MPGADFMTPSPAKTPGADRATAKTTSFIPKPLMLTPVEFPTLELCVAQRRTSRTVPKTQAAQYCRPGDQDSSVGGRARFALHTTLDSSPFPSAGVSQSFD